MRPQAIGTTIETAIETAIEKTMGTASRSSLTSPAGGRVRLGAAWAGWLVLSLLAAQTLGFAHRVAHSPLAAASAAAALHAAEPCQADASTAQPAAHLHRAAHGHPGLFDVHEAGGSECRLFDQVAQAETLLVAAPPALPPREPTQVPVANPTQRAADAACAYLARGPPARLFAGQQAA